MDHLQPTPVHLELRRADRRRFRHVAQRLLYTDGLVEASNGRADEFGSSRLSDFLARHSGLPADPVCTALLDQVTAWSGGQPESQQDHITFVAVEFPSPGSAAQAEIPDLSAVAAK
jgi:hypothetical protein